MGAQLRLLNWLPRCGRVLSFIYVRVNSSSRQQVISYIDGAKKWREKRYWLSQRKTSLLNV
jgi:hypothetical protein